MTGITKGLTSSGVIKSREKYGPNTIPKDPSHRSLHLLVEILSEPMFILLLSASVVYFLLGETTEGIMLMVALVFVSGISIFQNIRSDNALKVLDRASDFKVKVFRNNKMIPISKSNVVVGDYILLEEGDVIPADAQIEEAFDLSVNESILTGESFSVTKSEGILYAGTMVTSGSASARVRKVGPLTELGQLDLSMRKIRGTKSLLQIQINKFVRAMTLFGVIAFIIVWFLNFLDSRDILDSLLRGLTLAMSALPEEIPVAFSTFMALGAWRLIKKNVLTKQPQTVESLGAATVICLDKTGTITKNSMVVERVYSYRKNKSYSKAELIQNGSTQVLEDAMISSEVSPFDPMETAIHSAYKAYIKKDLPSSQEMIHEYPLEGNPPMMTHIFKINDITKVAAKGAWERMVKVCGLPDDEIIKIKKEADEMAKLGMRVLGTANASYGMQNKFPAKQDDFDWKFSGLIALSDPPKENIKEVFLQFYEAGIEIIMITGDYPDTAMAIAGQSGIRNSDKCLTGLEVMNMRDDELQKKINRYNVFARMFPQAKLRIIVALQNQGQVVSMTGDGVNDGPALKAADIGIAMGKRGTGIAREAAKMILVDDNLQNMVHAIEMGRRTYYNLKKAFRYIITIHIPIIIMVTLPLLLGWRYPNIFTPIHVIFLELIMGPTCSIIYENEPIEKGILQKGPRKKNESLFSWSELSMSVIQGLVISLGILSIYQYAVQSNWEEEIVRTMAFSTLIFSNMLLTLENRSFTKSICETIKYKNQLVPIILSLTFLLWLISVTIPAVQNLFGFYALTGNQILVCTFTSGLTVLWVELLQGFNRKKGLKEIGK